MVAVLDDDLDVADAICTCLRLQGLAAEAFSDNRALWAAVQATQFDAFVLDWMLARGTSEALVRMLRSRRDTVKAPIFLLTAAFASASLVSAPRLLRVIERYALQYRAKPLSCAALGQQLRQALDLPPNITRIGDK